MGLFEIDEPLTVDYLKSNGFRWDFFNGKHCYLKSFYDPLVSPFGQYTRIVCYEDSVNVYRATGNGFKLIYSKNNPDRSDIDIILCNYLKN